MSDLEGLGFVALKKKCKELGATDAQLGCLMGKPAALTLAQELAELLVNSGGGDPEPAAAAGMRSGCSTGVGCATCLCCNLGLSRRGQGLRGSCREGESAG